MLFIGAGVPVYAGMVVGETPKQEDISVNICKKMCIRDRAWVERVLRSLDTSAP